jgi:hypothetical protein
MYIKSLIENLKGEGCSEDLGVDRKIILRWIVGKSGGKLWIGFIQLKIGTSGRLM